MTAPFDPRPVPSRDTADVPPTVVGNAEMDEFAAALAGAQACAIDTETVYSNNQPRDFIGDLRVVSAATRDEAGNDHSWVVDVRSVDAAGLARALSGVHADAWNANFDARVIERDLIEPAQATQDKICVPVWWDVMLSDALLHQGLSGFSFYHSLAWATEWYLGLHATGKGSTQISFTAHDELSDEQITYAAADAVETLWIGQIVRERLREAGLEQICELEQSARPFLEQMQRHGLLVDVDGWKAELDRLRERSVELTTRLAALTGGGQAGLFDQYLSPNWNPNSEYDLRAVLNRHEPDLVLAWTEANFGQARALREGDGLGALTLGAIGGEICETILAFREVHKVVSTYGENLLSSVQADGRFHSTYRQVVGTHTGRLASSNPNAQNLTPLLKPYIKPATGNVFVYADLSQAELRFAAQIAGDTELQEAFRQGLDIHDATASNMFGVDMTDLRTSDSVRHELLRTKAKRINFGILYGLRGAGLARTLTEDGVPTERHEADELIDAYLKAYPGIAAWVNERDRFITNLAASHPPIDWQQTLLLHQLWGTANQARRALREQLHRPPTVEEVHAAVETGDVARTSAVETGDVARTSAVETGDVARTAWCLSFTEAIVLGTDAKPFMFKSRTLAGRRQQFTLRTDWLLEHAAETVANSDKPIPQEIWRTVLARQGGTVLARQRGTSATAADLSKTLENRELRRAVVDEVCAVMGIDAQALLLGRALRSRIEQLANAYRNSPIQGGVADVMLDAFARIHSQLSTIEGAKGVQTVHDSVVVECRSADADVVASCVQSALEAAMQHWCPDVPAVADTDIRMSLSDTDVVRKHLLTPQTPTTSPPQAPASIRPGHRPRWPTTP